ncbi:MAG: hypothetical protein ACTSQJ_06345 [Promethearchaeota archaeon]
MGFFAGLLWLGPACDFLSLLFTNHHIDNKEQLYGILSYMWVGPTLICAMYLGAEILIPEKKKIILVIYIVLGLIFEIILFIDRKNIFKFVNEEITSDLIDSQFVYFSPAFILIAIFLISIILFNGIGTLSKALQSTGDIRKKFLYLSFAFNLFVLVAVFDAFIEAGGILYIARFGMILCAWSMYMALKG